MDTHPKQFLTFFYSLICIVWMTWDLIGAHDGHTAWATRSFFGMSVYALVLLGMHRDYFVVNRSESLVIQGSPSILDACERSFWKGFIICLILIPLVLI